MFQITQTANLQNCIQIMSSRDLPTWKASSVLLRSRHIVALPQSSKLYSHHWLLAVGLFVSPNAFHPIRWPSPPRVILTLTRSPAKKSYIPGPLLDRPCRKCASKCKKQEQKTEKSLRWWQTHSPRREHCGSHLPHGLRLAFVFNNNFDLSASSSGH